MSAETLNCPMCGAAASSDSTLCEHCGARLATVACPSCFGMIFVGAKFCSHCGARADRAELANQPPQPCPRCKSPLEAVQIGNTNLRECPHCEGIWADLESLEQLCTDREKQSAVLGAAAHHPPDDSVDLEQTIRYVPCPVCHQLMNRVNFAHCSNVVVDVCKGHGTWFDKDELRRIVEFIRTGGFETARTREITELEQRKRELHATEMAGGITDVMPPGGSRKTYDGWDIGLSAAAAVLRAFLR